MRWNNIEDKKPFTNGRYWVYPYITLDGHKVVNMTTFRDQKWEEGSRAQSYQFWQKIEAPKAPVIERRRGDI